MSGSTPVARQASAPAGGYYDVQAASGEVLDQSAFGQYKTGSLAGAVWYDRDRNGAARRDSFGECYARSDSHAGRARHR